MLFVLVAFLFAPCVFSSLYFADVPSNLWQILDTGVISTWNITLNSGFPSFKRNYCSDSSKGFSDTFTFWEIGSNAIASFSYEMKGKDIFFNFTIRSGARASVTGQLGYGTAQTIVPGLQLCLATECNFGAYCGQFER